MIPLTLLEVARAVGGTLSDVPDPGRTVTGTVEFDSRRVTDGGLFVALRGERVDGHDYAGAAVAAGAVAVLAERPVAAPAVLVGPDSGGALRALADLAHEVVGRLPDLQVVGVTGSSGKTTTKDLLAQVLARRGPTVAPPESFNNEIGHPYTALMCTGQTRFLVLENSARGVGHIAALCRSVRPQVGIVLNVGVAHVGEFGSREVIARAKGELVEALPPSEAGGVAVLNADDPLVAAMAGRTRARVVTFGRNAPADVHARDAAADSRGRWAFDLVAGDAHARVALTVVGEHQVSNALGAAAAALALGMPIEDVAGALTAARAVSARRMDVRDRADGVTVINDSYNANPDSVRAALGALHGLATPGRRSWAVLGLMAELGADSPQHHRGIGERVAELGIDRLVTVGPEAAAILDGAVGAGLPPDRAGSVAEAAAAVELLRNEVRPGDVVLVKASKVEALWRVAETLLEDVPAATGERA